MCWGKSALEMLDTAMATSTGKEVPDYESSELVVRSAMVPGRLIPAPRPYRSDIVCDVVVLVGRELRTIHVRLPNCVVSSDPSRELQLRQTLAGVTTVWLRKGSYHVKPAGAIEGNLFISKRCTPETSLASWLVSKNQALAVQDGNSNHKQRVTFTARPRNIPNDDRHLRVHFRS